MSETRANNLPWPDSEQHRPKRGLSWVERSFERFRQGNVVRPQQEAKRYVERYGQVKPYPDVLAYDEARMAAVDADASPDAKAKHWARAERTPPCVKSGGCTIDSHEETCPYAGE